MRSKSRKIVLIIIGIALLALSIVGASYAYWIKTFHQTGMNKVKSGCFNLEISNELNAINLENAYPILNSEGAKLTPYSFTITNTCDLFLSYVVNLEMLEGTTLASKYIKTMVNKEAFTNLGILPITETTIDKAIEARILSSGSLGAGDSEEINLRLWMDEDVTIEDVEAMNKTFLSKVTIVASPSEYSPVKEGITKLKDAILANEYQTSVEASKEKIANKQAADFTSTAPIFTWQELHADTISQKNVEMPHPDLVGNGSTQTKNLTSTNIYPTIGEGYTFNEENGRYTLTSLINVDPTTLDYSKKDYYICDPYTAMDDAGNLTIIRNYENKLECHKIISATKEDATRAIPDGGSHKMVKYTFKTYKYTQIELESDKSEKGLYTMDDKDGISYYYRGNVNNNYVYFADTYWRIIRINGDGSTRLLYAGKEKGATGKNACITSLTYNNPRNHPGHVGYMYGNTLGVSYELEYANENNSNIKTSLDNWYKENIVNKNLSDYIADSGFCNDRSLASTSSGNGVQVNKNVTYLAKERAIAREPSLICKNKNDLFTLSNNEKGNQALTYPVGLITMDEMILAGGDRDKINRMTYTYINYRYYTMSPEAYDSSKSVASLFVSYEAGITTGSGTNASFGVRPVLNLNPDVEITKGIGTINEPFVIK